MLEINKSMIEKIENHISKIINVRRYSVDQTSENSFVQKSKFLKG